MSEAVISPVRMGRPAIGALGILALALGTLQSVVEPALPLLAGELDVSSGDAALIGNVLLITGAVITPIAGKLGDRFGGKRVLIWLMVMVSAGGLVASMAPNLSVLLLGQAMQGVMVGAMPLSFILVRKHLSTGESQTAIGVVVALFTGGSMVGMLFAGPVAEGMSWHWMFGLPTIVIIVMTLAVTWLMPRDSSIESDSKIDWLGVTLLSGTLLAFMIGLKTVTKEGGVSPLAVVAMVVGVAALAAAWVAVERRAVSPMVDLRMLAMPAMRNAIGLTFIITASFGMVVTLLSLMLGEPADGYGFGASTTDIGLLLLPGAIAGCLSDSVGGIAARRFGTRSMVVMGAVVTAATMMALAALHTAEWQLALAKVLTAFAAGIASTALLTSTATAVETKDTGIATSLLVVTRVVGTAVGAQIAGAILDSGADPVTGLNAESSFATAFVVAGLVAALSLLVVRFTAKKGAQA